jgi:hypothetical protein
MTGFDPSGEWPTHRAELSRKSTSVLEHWSNAYDKGKISKREFYILVTVLYDTTSGLVEKDISDLLAEIHKDLRRK